MPSEVRLFVPADRQSLVDMYGAVYGQEWATKTNFGWTVDSPLPGAGAIVAVEGEGVVAAQPFCDLPLHTPWGRRVATLFLDVATHPAHQQRGLFRRVVASATAAAFARGSSIVITTPNRIAARGFASQSAWNLLCSLDCLVLPLGPGVAVQPGSLIASAGRLTFAALSLIRGPKMTDSPALDGRVDTPWRVDSAAEELWSRARDANTIVVAREARFLQWRFGADYRLFLARNGGAAGAYAAARLIHRAGLRLSILVDCLCVDDGNTALPALDAVIGWSRDQCAAAVLGYFVAGSRAWHTARRAGFIRVPPAASPRNYPIYVAVAPHATNRHELLTPSRWHMSLADSDLA